MTATTSVPRSKRSPRTPSATYQTRICNYEGLERAEGDAALSAYARLYGQVERKLFAQMSKGQNASSLKGAYLEQYEIPARFFNSIRVSLEGKVGSVREQQKLRLDNLRARIGRAGEQATEAAQAGKPDQAHQKESWPT